jgi:ankyrin repeat protein
MKKQLPGRPNLEQLKKQAKAVLRGRKTSEFTLSDAQRTIANEYGFPSWAALKKHVLSHAAASDAAVSALLDAAARGDLAQVSKLLDEHAGIINERGGALTRTALHCAAGAAHEAVVRLLLERGADPNIRCEGDSATPLHFAAEKEHLGIIRLLIESGADPVGEGDYHELEIIGWATCFGSCRREIVEYLTAHGARHNIFSAVAMGEAGIIRKLVAQSHVNLEKRMDLANRRRMPLHLAVVKKQPLSVAALLELGANVESLDEASFTALDQAALSGEREIVELLLAHGAEVRLPAAFALERTRDIEKLLRKDPQCLKPGNRWGNLIVRASEQAPRPVIESLIRAGACVNVRDHPRTAVDSTSGYTPLHAAAFHGNISAAAVLLEHGANVRALDERYQGAPSGWAEYAGHAEVRDLILQGNIDIFEAIQRGLADRIPGILDKEPEALDRPLSAYLSDPAAANGWRTPLASAVTIGNAAAVAVLLDRGADPTVRRPDGRTLLEIAHETGNRQIVEHLSARSRIAEGT